MSTKWEPVPAFQLKSLVVLCPFGQDDRGLHTTETEAALFEKQQPLPKSDLTKTTTSPRNTTHSPKTQACVFF